MRNLPQSKDGKKITYTVSEEAVNGYTSVADGNNITNTHKVEKTSVSASKVWDDQDNKDSLRPSSVKVQLYANGAPFGASVTLNEANSWKHTWSDLDKNGFGAAIKYEVKEVDVPTGYTSEVTGDAASGFTVTNSHTPVVPPAPPTPPTPHKPGKPGKPVLPKKSLAKTGAGVWSVVFVGMALLVAGIALELRRRKARW